MQNLLLVKKPLRNHVERLSEADMISGMEDGSLKRLQKGVYQAVVGGKKIIPEERSVPVEPPAPKVDPPKAAAPKVAPPKTKKPSRAKKTSTPKGD
jgi:hypothetical protein